MDDISNMTLGSAENMIGRNRISSDFGSGNMSTNNYGGFASIFMQEIIRALKK